MRRIYRDLSGRTLAMYAIVAVASLSFVACGSKYSYQQIATGQTTAYDADGAVIEGVQEGDALYGQDAHYLAGAQMSYTNNGDGTVTDLNTGLMWQMVPVSEGFDWQGANDYCESLELGGYDDWRLPSAKELYSISDFGAGWPYINTTFFKMVDGNSIGKDEQYWTNNRYVGTIAQGGSSSAFGVNHATGHIKAYAAGGARRSQGEGQDGQMAQRQQRGEGQEGDMSQRQRPQQGEGQDGQMAQRQQRGEGSQGGEMSQRQRPQQGEGQDGQMAQRQQRGEGQEGQGGQMAQRQQRGEGSQGGRSAQQGGSNPMQKYVRAVRGDVYGVNNFKDNGNGTVTDKATGLMWTKADSGEGMDWVAALQYAESSEEAGYSDWRLPNVKELQGIVDYRFAPNATEEANVGAAIDPIFSTTEITNERGDKDYPYFWTGTSALFQRARPYYYAWYVAFGRAASGSGVDSHGAGGVRFDTKHEGGPAGEGGERYYNYVRLVRNVK